jgi:hypothetical protein
MRIFQHFVSKKLPLFRADSPRSSDPDFSRFAGFECAHPPFSVFSPGSSQRSAFSRNSRFPFFLALCAASSAAFNRLLQGEYVPRVESGQLVLSVPAPPEFGRSATAVQFSSQELCALPHEQIASLISAIKVHMHKGLDCQSGPSDGTSMLQLFHQLLAELTSACASHIKPPERAQQTHHESFQLESLQLIPEPSPLPAASQERDHEEGLCIICLESDPAPSRRGCACRGDAGLSHVGCMVKLAESHRVSGPTKMPWSAWVMCQTCKSYFTGTMSQELADAWFERSRALPVDDPNRVDSRRHMIVCLYTAGNYSEAATQARLMLDETMRTLGDENPTTMATGALLSNSLFAMGEYEEAEAVQRDVLAATIRTSGPTDAITATQMSTLANILCEQKTSGKLAEALHLSKGAIAILRGSSDYSPTDQEHMFLDSASVLARLFAATDDSDGASALYREILATESRVLGPDHPQTLHTAANLASTLNYQGKYEESKRILIGVLRTMRIVLGHEHPHTLAAKDSLEYAFRCSQEDQEDQEAEEAEEAE